MNPVLAEVLSTKQVLARDGSSVPLDYHIDPDEGAKLQELIVSTRARVTLEVGCGYGVSTLYMCEALQKVGGSRHIIIDPDQTGDGWRGIGLFTAERAGYGPLIDFHGSASDAVLPELVRSGTLVDVALIDGWHTFDYVLVDFFYVDRLLRTGGAVVFDDTRWYPAIRKVVRYVARHRQYVPLPNHTRPSRSPARWVFDSVAAVARLPGIRSVSRHIVRPELMTPDAALGLPADNFVAFRKLSDDRRGDGSDGTRKWDQHFDF